MHRGTHMDAPMHVTANQPYMTGYPLWRFFGTGVAVSIPKGKWGVITPDDLENATPTIEPNDIVMINTGSHHDWGDNDEYFVYGPGLYREAAEWLVERRVKLVGVDVQALDHPLGTKLVAHGTGPDPPAADGRVPSRDGARRHGRLPRLGARAQDDAAGRHPGYRERRRRARRGDREALHVHGLPLALSDG